MKVLITGFDPFNRAKINPAYEILKEIPDLIGDCKIVKKEIPTVFNKSLEVLEETIEKEQPDIVICLGQAGGRSKISTEFVGINLNEANIDDNEGNRPSGTRVIEDGPNAYFSTLPNKAIVKALLENKIPAEISYTAGTFVCNHILYGLLHMIDRAYPHMRGGFVHVPYLPEQVLDMKNEPSMSYEMMVKAITVIIETSIENEKDVV